MSPSLYKFLALCGIMPRDLFSPSDPKDDSLVASPESQTPRPEGAAGLAALTGNDDFPEFIIHSDETGLHHLPERRAKASEKDNLHPYVQTLSISNLESCVALENAIFPEQERCSREKVELPLIKHEFETCTISCEG